MKIVSKILIGVGVLALGYLGYQYLQYQKTGGATANGSFWNWYNS